MGWFSKKWKSLKKSVKGIGKKIKKAFVKVGAAFGKLGVLGQIGLMFLMPYATGALGSFFGAGGTLSSWSAGLLKVNNIAVQAVGHGLNIVQKAAAFAGKVYTTVSDTIGNAIDRVGNAATGKGFTLSADRTSVFAKGNERSIFSGKAPVKTPPTKSLLSANEVQRNFEFDTKFEADTAKFDKILNKDLSTFSDGYNKKGELMDFFKADFDIASTARDTVVENITEDKSLFRSILDTPKEIIDRAKSISSSDIADFAQDQVTTTLTGGIQAAGQQDVAEFFGYKQITPVSYNISLDNAMGGNQPFSAVYNDIDLTTQPTNSYYTSNIANSNYLNDLIMPQNADYQAHMSEASSGMYYGKV